MKVSHRLKDFIVEKEVHEGSFILSNAYGSYFFFMEHPVSRFQGFFWFIDGEMHKVIEHINILGNPKIQEIENSFSSAKVKYNDLQVDYFVPRGKDALVLDSDREFEAELKFDIRHAYDSREFGRFFDFSIEKSTIVLKYTKYTDSNEDGVHGNKEYETFVCIAMDKPEYEKIGQFIEHKYPLDKERNSRPFSRYVYSAMTVKTKRLAIAVSSNKKDAIRQAKYVYKKYEKLKKRDSLIEELFLYESEMTQKNFAKKINSISNPLLRMAYLCSINSLQKLTVRDKKRIFAGLPWFFQYWTRDEAITLKALMLNEQYRLADSILKLQTKNIGPQGLIPNRIPESKLASADGAGWVWKRVEDLINASYILKKKDMKVFEESLKHSVYLQRKFLTRGVFAVNGPKETWMDTTVGDQDTRDGVRIEIQAQRLMMYSLLYCFEWDSRFRKIEEDLRNKVREKLFNGDYLFDGLWDETKRPNVFLAYYIYPDLLKEEEWMRTFDTIIDALWLPWGGIASIDKSSPWFKEYHTGETNESYHRGDSWFWVNNIAAICMYRLDKYRYKEFIEKIISASTHEILFSGAIGHAAEISSANRLMSQGCLAQAWSAATYVELVEEVMHEP